MKIQPIAQKTRKMILPLITGLAITAGTGMVSSCSNETTEKTNVETTIPLKEIGLVALGATALGYLGYVNKKSKEEEKGHYKISKCEIPEKQIRKNDKIKARIQGITYESYVSDGAKIYRDDIALIHDIAKDAIDCLVENANVHHIPLEDGVLSRIEEVKANEQKLIDLLYAKAKLFPSGSYIKIDTLHTLHEHEARFKYSGEELPLELVGTPIYASSKGTHCAFENYFNSTNLIKENIKCTEERTLEALLKELDTVSPESIEFKNLIKSQILYINNEARHGNKKVRTILERVIKPLCVDEQKTILQNFDNLIDKYQRNLQIKKHNNELYNKFLNK